MDDGTLGINPNQSVEGMVHDYNKKLDKENKALSDPDDMSDVPKDQMEPNRESIDLVRRGRLNPETGVEVLPSPKTRSAQRQQFGRVSAAYTKGYEAILWNT